VADGFRESLLRLFPPNTVDALDNDALAALVRLVIRFASQPDPALPPSGPALARLAGVSSSDWPSVESSVLAHFARRGSGYVHPLLAAAYERERQRSVAQAANGRASGEARRARKDGVRDETNGGSTVVQPWFTVGSTLVPPPPAPPSPLRDKKKKKEKTREAAIAWTPAGGWTGIADEDRRRWALAFPACDIDRQLAAADVWLRANPERAHKSNWDRFLTGWLKREQDRGGDMRHAAPRATGPAPGAAEQRRAQQRGRDFDEPDDWATLPVVRPGEDSRG